MYQYILTCIHTYIIHIFMVGQRVWYYVLVVSCIYLEVILFCACSKGPQQAEAMWRPTNIWGDWIPGCFMWTHCLNHCINTAATTDQIHIYVALWIYIYTINSINSVVHTWYTIYYHHGRTHNELPVSLTVLACGKNIVVSIAKTDQSTLFNTWYWLVS